MRKATATCRDQRNSRILKINNKLHRALHHPSCFIRAHQFKNIISLQLSFTIETINNRARSR